MGKVRRKRGFLTKTVHPSIVALLFLVVTIGTVVGIRRYEVDITAHYDEINQIAENQPRFPRPGNIAGISSNSSADEQSLPQPGGEIPYNLPDNPPTAAKAPVQPSSQGLRESSHESPPPAEPPREPTPAPPGPLVCVIGICL